MTPDLPAILSGLGSKGLRLSLREDALGVLRPGHLAPEDLAPLRLDVAAVKAEVARKDADLAEAMATLDALAARPGTSAARLAVIQARREVYREYRARLDPTDLGEDARHFAARLLDPPPPAYDWLHPRDCR